MPPTRSPEIESVARRTVQAYAGDFETLRNLMSSDPSLRVLGFDRDEWWKGSAVFDVRQAQSEQQPEFQVRIAEVEGFEDGEFGWATVFSTIVTPDEETQLRTSMVLRIEAGVWRVVQWHNSSPVPNQQVFGVEITTTLDDLVTSILSEGNQMPVGQTTEGTMTLVFTDVVDSTPFAERVGDDKWAALVAQHEAVIGAVTASHGGTVVKFLGDGSMLAFESARAAVRTAVEIQKATLDAPFSVRIGVHTGEVQRSADDLFGLTVNKAARIAAAGDADEVMISSTTRDLIGSMDGVEIGDTKTVALKGLSDIHQISPVVWN
ncbi:MAG: nuclear transport factor 2 family protein [Acidimicrobiia bacterium]|nr:nuclear transport factor 2 family protein [Acidimicrobiia bacterium]NNL26887.1 SnoaL-like domain-containing protein [Acidimicrobiia bacterium]